jgi:hypothetical protein
LLDINESLLTLAQMEKLVSFQPRFDNELASGKTAIVVQEGFLSGLSRSIAMQSNMLEATYVVMVFSSRDTAYKWFDEP